jgi:hypothetical protein
MVLGILVISVGMGFISFFGVLGAELRALCLLSRCSHTSAILPGLFELVIFERWFHFMLGLAWTMILLFVLPTVCKSSHFSTSSLAFVISCLFDDSYSKWGKTIVHCGFDLHFPDDYWNCTSSCICWPFACLLLRSI